MSLQDGELVIHVQGGARLCVPGDVRLYTPYILLEQEDWFEDEIRFVRRWLAAGMQALDVGSSYGAYTVAMARAVSSNGRVWAFEPTPEVGTHLERSLRLNGLSNVSLRRAAVSARPGTLEFTTGAHAELNAVDGTHVPQGTATRVQAVTLDEMAANEGWDAVDFVKIDVEGHEAEVIRGGRKFFAQASPLVMVEIKAQASFDMSPLRMLGEMGYRAYHLLPGPLVLAPMTTHEPVSDYQLNAFACKDDRAALLASAGLLAHAPSVPGDPPPHAGCYESALAWYARSRSEGQSADERVGCLREARRLIARALDERDTVPRRLSHARVARDLMLRDEAIEALRNAFVRIDAEAGSVLGEPLLAPSPRAERPAAEGASVARLKGATLEALEKLRAFSSCFNPQPEIVDAVLALPGHSPEMQRRRQLMRMLAGEQRGPEPVAALLERSEDNLNPEFWAGRGAA